VHSSAKIISYQTGILKQQLNDIQQFLQVTPVYLSALFLHHIHPLAGQLLITGCSKAI
jgi:hypothetical protein